MNNYLTKREAAAIEANFDNTREAWRWRALIDAEFRTDPMSTQCFDLRVVQRVRECMARREAFVATRPLDAD